LSAGLFCRWTISLDDGDNGDDDESGPRHCVLEWAGKHANEMAEDDATKINVR